MTVNVASAVAVELERPASYRVQVLGLVCVLATWKALYGYSQGFDLDHKLHFECALFTEMILAYIDTFSVSI